MRSLEGHGLRMSLILQLENHFLLKKADEGLPVYFEAGLPEQLAFLRIGKAIAYRYIYVLLFHVLYREISGSLFTCQGKCNQAGHIARIGFLQQVVPVPVHRTRTDEQLFGNLIRGLLHADQP
jgi:hypothetical protein